MKKIVLISLIIGCVCGITVSASAQLISWEIKQHSTNVEELESEVTDYVYSGYVPLGITYNEDELYVLYVQDDSFGMQAWSIEWYDDWSKVQSGITANMEQYYIPTGITYTGELFYVLYIQVDSTASAWQLTPSTTDLQSVQDAVQLYVDQGYVPVGITAFNGQYWTLLLYIPNTTVQAWMIERYAVGMHGDAINENIEMGYVPWGILYRGDAIDVLYVGF